MICFEHKENQSIGVCAGCLKGVCLECFCEVEEILSCRNQKCQDRISDSRRMKERAEKIYGIGKGSKGIPISSIFFILMGLIFIAVDLILWYRYGVLTYFALICGFLFFAFGLFQFFRKDRINY